MTADGNPFLDETDSAEGPADPSRRGFLRAAGSLGGLALAPGVTLYAFGAEAQGRPSDKAVTSRNRWGMLIDAGRCGDGCKACITACADEHGWDANSTAPTDAHWIRKVELRDPEGGLELALPMMCQHCASPPCVDVCPTGASFKRADGIVLVDKHTCIGCRYCMMACPYNARSFIHEAIEDQKPYAPRGKGTVESCTLCVHRVDEGRQPACVEACSDKAGGAMLFGDLNDPESEISKRIATYATVEIRSDLGLDTGVRYRNI